MSILLVHGWGVSGALFDAQFEALSGRFRVVVPDLPGHGASADLPEDADFALLGDSVAGLVTELALERVCLVGWSLGALVAWDLLRRHPRVPVSGLATIDMVPRLLNDADWRFGLREGDGHHVFDRHIEWMSSDWSSYSELFVSRIFAAGVTPGRDLSNRVLDVARRNDPRNMAAIWKRMVEQDFRDVLPMVRQPALVAAGRHSQLYGESAAEWLVQQMPAARLAVFEHSGHAPQLEEPEAFNRLLAEFADSLIEL